MRPSILGGNTVKPSHLGVFGSMLIVSTLMAADQDAALAAKAAATVDYVAANTARTTADESRAIADQWHPVSVQPHTARGNIAYDEGEHFASQAQQKWEDGVNDFNAGVSQMGMANWVGAVSLFSDAAGFFQQAASKWLDAELKYHEATIEYQGGP